MKSFLTRHSLSVGLILMFLVTWTIELSNAGVLPFKVPFVVALTVGWAFIFISLLMTWLTLGKGEMARLFMRFFLWRVGWRWHLVALLLLPALQLASILLTSWLTGAPADYSHPMIREVAPIDAPLLALLVPWMLFEILTNGEEMGWRGYVLPRLQARHSALVASLVVGVIWGFWHLPKFLGSGMSNERSLAWFIVAHLALAILYTWLYNSTRGSLLLVTLFHASGNTAGIFLPVSFAVAGGVMQNLLIVLIILAAVIVTVATGPARLSRVEEKQVQE
ncbi:MAG: CPBP family intramembrane metalloprotease [Caldilinea sp.]|nr:CPBP family intramembrane metalloprotease [Caldilinea sp.]